MRTHTHPPKFEFFHANSKHDAGDSGGGTGRGCEHIGCPACVNLGAI